MKLVIAEKPIAARRIASILGNPKTVKLEGVECYQSGDYFIVPLKGHVMNVDFPKALNNWSSTPLTALVLSKLEYKPVMTKVKKALLKAAEDADEVIIATDYDREGESIGKEAINIIREKFKSLPVKRAKFSALTPEEVRRAFDNLVEFDYNLADAADARREIDLIWGAVLTRFVSLASGRLGKSFLSVGRVQTPTLAMIVNREKEIMNFKPEDYWVVFAECFKGEKFKAVYHEEKIKSEDKVKSLLNIKAKQGVVVSVKRRKFKVSPPCPFNTTEFLRAATSLGFQPEPAMNIAEKLYMMGYISYPRTDNTHYPKLDFKSILKKLSTLDEFRVLAEKLISKKQLTPTHGKKKATDHPPIHPVAAADKKKLSEREWKIYELIVRRFMATLADDYVGESMDVELSINDEKFVAKGKRTLERGWRDYYPYSKVEEVILPDLSKGDTVEVLKIYSEKKQTKPKPRFSPSVLIKLMDEKNLGTKSTRPTIIQKLIDRGYIQGRKNFKPSQISFAVIDTLEKHAGDITNPKMTALLEREMDLVEKGKKKKEEVVEESRNLLLKILKELEDKKQGIGEKLRDALKQDKVLGKCPECGGDLVIIKTKKGTRFVGCSNYSKGCRISFPLPAKGKITILKKKCPECGLPMIRVKMKGKRAFEMCINHKCKSKEKWGK